MKPLKGYEYLSTITENATTIWLARDIETQTEVVVKTLNLKQVEDWKGIELFEREVATLRQLDHPSIPKFIDFVKDTDGENQRWHIVQEKVKGDTISSLIETGSPFDENQLLSLVVDVLDILIYLQGFSPPLFHRDIKPANLMRTDEGIFLFDFGSVRYVVPKAIGGSTIVGTNGYMAPEQLMGRADMSSDLYALGMTLIHLITGTPPNALPMARLRVDWESTANVHLSKPFCSFLNQLTHPDPTLRFTSASSARQAANFATLPKSLIPQADTAPTIDFRRAYARTYVVFPKVLSPKFFMIGSVGFALCIILFSGNPIVAALVSLILFSGFALTANGLHKRNELTLSMLKDPSRLRIEYGSVIGLLMGKGKDSDDEFPFEDVLESSTEQLVKHSREAMLPLKIGNTRVTPPLSYANRSELLEEMKRLIRKQKGKIEIQRD